jgi:tyrosinase
LDERFNRLKLTYACAKPRPDAANFYDSAFFKESDPKSGLGGWGGAATQFRVLDGGFSASSSFRLSYPFPHTLRRNFTLFPPLELVYPVPGLPYNDSRPASTSFIKPVVQSLTDGFVGDFKGFQTRMEGVEVSAAIYPVSIWYQ